LSDLRLLGRAMGYNVIVPPPSRFDTRIIILALVSLCASGALIVYWGLQANPEYLNNPKLQAKLVLVGLLIANAFVLHLRVFPKLAQRKPISQWPASQVRLVSASVGLSNCLWVYCAFLGIARPWNFAVPIYEVLAVGLALWIVVVLAVRTVLFIAGREQPVGRPSWIDLLKGVLRRAVAEAQDTMIPREFERSRILEVTDRVKEAVDEHLNSGQKQMPSNA
jgi:hypothetical protein